MHSNGMLQSPIFMEKIINAFKNPVFIFGLLLVLFSAAYILNKENRPKVVTSDGRGYYAYLPALLIYHDNSFEKSAAVEKSYFPGGIDQLYLFKDAGGKKYNKYPPGVSILQLPFFLLGCLLSFVLGSPVDGYSGIFMAAYYLGSIFYLIAGLHFFSKCIRQLFPQQNALLRWIVPFLYLSSTVVGYALFKSSFSHHYSFFLFGLFAWQILRLKSGLNPRGVFLAGMILGLIALVRPTNLTVILIIPFLLGDRINSIHFFKSILGQPKYLFSALSGFLLLVSIFFFSWKWQTGNWFVWSYNGEGFSWFRPQLWAIFFSFRCGLFIHTPVMLLSIAGVAFLWRKNAFQAISWILYLLINAWIISAWWCWDYETSFGNRPFTEHLFFLLLPAGWLILEYKRFSVSLLSICALIGMIRLYEAKTGFINDQRFTSGNYFSSLLFWKEENHGRWNFTRSCPPFGKKINDFVLLDQPEMIAIAPKDEFVYTVEKSLSKPRTNERFYYNIQLEKKISESPLENVFLVIDAYNAQNDKRFYRATELFNDRKEGLKDFHPLAIEGLIPDYLQEYDFIRIYIWNQGKKTLWLKNVKFTIEEYKTSN